MSYVLKKNNVELIKTLNWSPRTYGNVTGTSYPAEVTQDYVWENEGYWLGWIPDPVAPEPTQEEILQQYTAQFINSIQEHLDSTAKAKGYDNIVSACSYAGAPNPFQSESIAFITWRGDVWAYCYQELAKVKSGERPIPDLQDFINELPTINFN
jgi:hypothetical protein